jgi:mevalonate kinase
MSIPHYPSKVLLLGEYTIIQNSAALAIPYTHYKSYWNDDPLSSSFENTIDPSFSKQSLQKIALDLKSLDRPLLNLKQLEEDLNNGLWLCTNSPMGYGLGSSGAVCAAIYDRYGLQKTSDLQLLKQDLALLEHSFHGKSSGIDPLIAYIKQPLWVHSDKSIEPIQLPKRKEGSIFLIDTQLPRISTPLINFFVASCEQAEFNQSFVAPVSSAVDKAIHALIEGNFKSLMQSIQVISELQFAFLPPMVPSVVHELWQRGLDSNDFYIKICGAGGGGFMLGFAPDWEKVKQHFDEFETLQLL